MTTSITTSTIDSQMHNNIMAGGSRDCPSMLATRIYARQSRFLRYIDTKLNGDAMSKCILEGPYTPSTITVPVVPATDDSPEVLERTSVETILNMSPENKEHYQSEKEAIRLLLTGIGGEIYSTVDACKTAHDMWIAIERLQQGEYLNIQDVKTNLFWEFGRFTSHDGETMKSYYSRFYKMMNEMIRNNLTVATMQVNVQFLMARIFMAFKEVNEIHAERIAKNTNPLALIAATQQYSDPYYQAPKSYKSYAPPSKQSFSTRSHAYTKYKRVQWGDRPRGKWKPKRVKDYSYHKEKMLLCKQAEKGVPLQAEQADWLEDMDEEMMNKNCKHIITIWQRFRSGKVDSNVIPNSPNMCNDDIQTDQNVEECDDERVVLANLIAKLKLDIDENKKIQKQLTKANTSLTHELKDKQTELETYKTLNDRTVDYDKLEHKNIAISELKKLIDKFKGKPMETKFDKPSVVRQPNAQRIPKPSVLGKPTPFSDSLERKSFSKTKSGNLRVIHRTSVSIPQLRSTQMKYKVVPNNSQVKFKKTKVERPTIDFLVFLNKTKSVTADRMTSLNLELRIWFQLILFIVDSGCTKHMTGNLKLLCNFVEKYLGAVRFGNDQFAPILGYEDLVQGYITISRGNYLLTGNRDSDLYTISLQETTSSTPICFMAKASPTQSWLWHRKLSHLNFDYINLLSKKNIVIGLPKLKYVKDQLCSSCEASKAKRSSFKTKDVPSSKGRLHLLHMDLCGHMRVASINGKKYILMKEKGDPCILVGYSTQSKGYRVYNKRTRMIDESIHIKFDEIKEMSQTSVANNTSGLVLQRQMASDRGVNESSF
ncbi:retrovirus-related pol polyprotein from transposon TNT 1-94 [Tanacetum coccineum]